MTGSKRKKKHFEDNQSKKKYPWHFIAIGPMLALILDVVLFRKFSCFYTYQPLGKVIIGGIGVLAGALIGYFSKSNRIQSSRKIQNYIFLLCSLLFSGAAIIFFSAPFFEIDINSCVADYNELVGLIDQEGSAIVDANLSAIKSIYAPQAVVTNNSSNESFPAYLYYSDVFANYTHCSNVHSEYQVVSYSPNEVVMTTGSQGTWGPKNRGCIYTYNNPGGSDKWIFKKINGEWKIVNFTFNLK